MVGELQEELREWEDWWGEEEPLPQQQEVAGQQPANAELLQPTTPQQPQIMLRGQVPAQFLPPATLPCTDAVMPPQPAVQSQGVGVQQEQAQQAAGQIPAPAPQLAPMAPHSQAPHSQVAQPVIQRTLGQTSAYISPLPTVSQAPPATAGPWSRTREVYRNAAAASNPHVDPFSIPMSAGVSEASAGPTTNQMQWASGSAAGSLAGYSLAGACPAVGVPPPQMTTPITPAPAALSPAPEAAISKLKSSLPKLNIKGGDPTTITRVINEWLQKTAIALNTWSLQASTFWNQAVQVARQQHAA